MCLCVCHKSHYFCIQKIWSFHTFIATFRTQRKWSFPCFLTLSVFKGFGRFPCLYTLSVIKSIQRIWSNLLFLYIFRLQKCPERVKQQNPLKYSKNLVNSSVSRHCLLGKVGILEGLKIGRFKL